MLKVDSKIFTDAISKATSISKDVNVGINNSYMTILAEVGDCKYSRIIPCTWDGQKGCSFTINKDTAGILCQANIANGIEVLLDEKIPQLRVDTTQIQVTPVTIEVSGNGTSEKEIELDVDTKSFIAMIKRLAIAYDKKGKAECMKYARFAIGSEIFATSFSGRTALKAKVPVKTFSGSGMKDIYIAYSDLNIVCKAFNKGSGNIKLSVSNDSVMFEDGENTTLQISTKDIEYPNIDSLLAKKDLPFELKIDVSSAQNMIKAVPDIKKSTSEVIVMIDFSETPARYRAATKAAVIANVLDIEVLSNNKGRMKIDGHLLYEAIQIANTNGVAPVIKFDKEGGLAIIDCGDSATIGTRLV